MSSSTANFNLPARDSGTETPNGCCLQRFVRGRASDKTVRDLPLKVKIKDGQIIVEQQTCGVCFSFPAIVWPAGYREQAEWGERLTPWWDMCQPDWTPQAQRLRESCRKAINNLSVPVALKPQTANAGMESSNVRVSASGAEKPTI